MYTRKWNLIFIEKQKAINIYNVLIAKFYSREKVKIGKRWKLMFGICRDLRTFKLDIEMWWKKF